MFKEATAVGIVIIGLACLTVAVSSANIGNLAQLEAMNLRMLYFWPLIALIRKRPVAA